MMKREVKIGIFLTGAFLIIATIIFIVGDMSKLFRKPGYTLLLRVESALGLDKSTSVKMAGIKIGYVKDIRLEKRTALVTLSIYPEYQIPRGSKGLLASLGILGEKYLEILPGVEEGSLKAGDALEAVQGAGLDQIAGSFQAIGKDIGEVGESVKGILNAEVRDNLTQSLKNLSSLTAELSELVGRNKAGLDRTVQNTSEVVRKFDRGLQQVTEGLDQTLAGINRLLDENRESVKFNLDKIREITTKLEESIKLLNGALEKINSGKGTLGKLINESDLHSKAEGTLEDIKKIAGPVSAMKAKWDVQAAYYGERESLKCSLTAALWLSPARFVQGQIVHNPWLDKFVYSVQGGFRWGGLAPRAGIIESNLGAGVDFYALGDRLAFSLEGFNFDRRPRPEFRLFTRYYPRKDFFLVLGVDDLALDSKREIFFGLGVGL
ncbi:MAG TPA: MlaD family protein [Candidatus Aminicenantes bacterium]|nr:MlaD family protein [Candidatus Aminicenantes bacterium]